MSMVQDEVGNWYDDDVGMPSVDDDFPSTYSPAVMPSVDDDFSPTYPDVKAAVMPSIDDDFSPTFPITGGGNGGRSVVGGGNGIRDIANSIFGGPSGVKTAGVVAGALAGGLGGTSPNKQRSGYQGSIPQYTAVRNMVNAPPTGPGYRPGQGGVNYGGNVSYVPRGSVPNAVGTPMNPTGVNPAINPKTPSSTISNLAKVAGGAGIATLINKLLTEGKGGNTDGIKSIIDKITGGGTKTTTGTSGGTGIAGAVTKGVTNLPGTVKTTPTGTPAGTPASTVKTTPAGTPAGTPTKGGTPAGGGGIPRGIGGTPSIPTGVADDGTTEGIKETIGEIQGTAYDDDGNLMPGYELDEDGNPVYVGDGDSTTVFNPDGTIGEKTDEDESEDESEDETEDESEDESEDDTTFNWDEDMGVDLDEEELDLEEPEFDFEEEEFDFEEPEFAFDDEELARGGIIAMAKGRYLQGGTDGMADKIPARIGKRQPAALSHGEFVIPADVVSHMGNGNSDAGAKKLYQMMDKIRMARTGSKEQGKKINPDKFMPGGLALAYANGGRVRHFAGGGDSGLGAAASAGITGSEQAPNTWAGGYMSDLLGKTQALTESPYQQYMGPLTAGASNLQNKVSQGLSNIAFPGNLGQSFSSMGGGQQYGATSAAGGLPPGAMAMPAYKGLPSPNMSELASSYGSEMPQFNQLDPSGGMGSASPARLPMEGGAYDPSKLQPGTAQTGMPQQGIAGLQPPQGSQQPSNIAQQYMNPYLQSVLNPQMDELRRQNEITNMQANAKLTGAGAFGGGRQAIMNAENNRNLMQEQNKTVGAGYANAYDKAQQQFNTEQGQARTLVDMLSQQGGTERGIEAEGIAADKAAFEAARENPYKMLQFQQSMLNGLPISATNYDVAEPSKLVSAAQGATTVNALLKNLGLA